MLSSCESNFSNQTPSIQESQRLDIAKSQTKTELKDKFNKLSFNDQKTLWSDKINQIQSKNVSKKHNELLVQLNEELSKAQSINDLYNDNLEHIALALAAITPQSDFIEMFISLDNYNGSFDSNNFKACEECVAGIANDFKEKKEIMIRNAKINTPPQKEPNCNCSWTCGDGPGEVTTNCLPSGGCGFLFLFTCKKYQ